MPPILALIICLMFVFVLLWIERKQAPSVSGAIWMPSCWMLIIASKPLGRWTTTAAGGDEGNLLDQTFLIILLVVGFAMLLRSKGDALPRATKVNWPLWLLITYMLVSALWSDFPFVSFKRWIREIVAVVMALVILTEREPRVALQSLLRRTIFILIPVSILLIKYFPELGVQYRNQGGLMWTGVALQKNGLGRLCLIATFFLIWTLVRRWRGIDAAVNRWQTPADISVLVMALYLISGPEGQYSATAITSLSVGLVLYIGLLARKNRSPKPGAFAITGLAFVVLVVGILQPFLGGGTVTDFASDLGRDVTLTGRTEIWEGLVPAALQHPIFGYGFESFWTQEMISEHAIGEAHNGYLDVILGLGFFGLLLVSLFLLSSCRRAQALLATDHDWGSLWICMLVMSIVHNMAESSINSFASHLTAILLFLAVSLTPTMLPKPFKTSPNPPIAPGRQTSTLQRNSIFV